MQKLLEKQKKYFLTGKTKNVDFRIEQLKNLQSSLIKREKEIIEALKKDLNKSETESYTTEIGTTLEEIKHAIKYIRSWIKPKYVGTPLIHFKSQSYIYSEPYGVSLIIGAWNYPICLCLIPLIGSISAGNCSIVKPSENAPHCAKILEKIIKETFSDKFVTVINGGVETATKLLQQKFDYIFYTGGVQVGKIVMEAAAKNLIPVTLELGGKSPCIVHNDADIEITARRIVWGKFMNIGQTCVAPDYVYAHQEVKDKLIERMSYYIREFYSINPKQSPDYGRIINQKHLERLSNLLNEGKIIIGGEIDKKDLYIAPTIIDKINWKHLVMQEEIFGPILPIMTYNDLSKVIKEINDHPKPLALYFFSNNKELQNRIITETSSGGITINAPIYHQLNPELPFGGVGESGIGSYHGKFSFEAFSHKKSVLIKSFSPDLKLAYPPFKNKLWLFKKLWG
jgi:acyl-CoA reductase-like NAD-dependent aldehyde dehydrogenase